MDNSGGSTKQGSGGNTGRPGEGQHIKQQGSGQGAEKIYGNSQQPQGSTGGQTGGTEAAGEQKKWTYYYF
eukprot:g3551.t1